ncbi:ABC transporter ATP-binding protein [Staphylococcus warneri]|uniref:ABC transporter ATP-binding protein n=1 Tax=Staphylococcus warneri TaxID=1292 RepID=UPI000F6D3387|nr:ABC transporter ATP-binding protein [Staphylococcus warneri]VED29867.1 ABC transporter [Staphylococcus warneri]
MENIIEMSRVTKNFNGEVVIDDMNIEVKKGEIFGFLGPSGAGKTTTINMLIGFSRPSKGSLKVNGFNNTSIGSSKFMATIGILTDLSNIYERLTVYDNLKLIAQLYEIPLSKVEETLELVHLKHAKKKVCKNLSAGMKQRVLLAKSLIHTPDILFLDEPTSSLDPTTTNHIHRGLKALNEKGTTVFLTTHDMDEANKLCDRIAFINHGKVKLIDTPQNLRYSFSNHSLTVIDHVDVKKTMNINKQTADYIHDLMLKDEIKYLSTDLPTLGEVFLKVTGEELNNNENE